MRVDGSLVIGAGLAGLFTALKLAPRPVTVLSPEPVGGGGSSTWAQAGIAAAMDPGDSPALHARDTVAVGCELVDAALAESVAREAPERVADLARFGTRFDHTPEGVLLLAREAGHSAARIAGTGADRAGRAIMSALSARARACASIRFLEGMTAVELVRDGDRVAGCRALPVRDTGAEPLLVVASQIVLAAGGLCGLYAVTTNPPLSRGQALGLAARAGAVLADCEFVQFHPTAIDAAADPAPLATEALRGAGARLVGHDGTPLLGWHPDRELAPRDIVARAVHQARLDGSGACLDARGIFSANPQAFPTVARQCHDAGIDPSTDVIPVAPAAHFHIGGVRSDDRGRSSLPGLYVCGEAAATGLHGANRLGSNSLLEATVFAHRIAEEISGLEARPARDPRSAPATARGAGDAADAWIGKLRRLMDRHVGVIRDGAGLRRALGELHALEHARTDLPHELRNMTAAATLVAAAALRRAESRGAHFRTDFPATGAAEATPRTITLTEACAIRASCVPGP